MTIDINGLKINYVYENKGKKTVLFLHGWGAPISLYQRVFDRLVQMDYAVAAFDMPGVGASGQPEEPMSLEDYVELVLGFCALMNIEECILMAHSHGGRVALSLLADDNCPIKIEKAVLMGCAGIPFEKPKGFFMRTWLYKAAKALGTGKYTSPIFGDLYEKMRYKYSSDDYRAASEVMRQTMNNVIHLDLRPLMPNIKASVLLIFGENDTATPLYMGKEMEKLIKGSGLAVIKNAGHYCFSENFSQFSAVLDAFL